MLKTNSSNARLLLETKYRRLPVVDGDGKLVRIMFTCFSV